MYNYITLKMKKRQKTKPKNLIVPNNVYQNKFDFFN